MWLTNWGQVTHICVSKFSSIGADNGLSPGRRQAIIWTNARKLLIRPFGTNFNEMLIEILTFSFLKMCLKVSSAKWRPFCLVPNVLNRKNHNNVIKLLYLRIKSWIHERLFPFSVTPYCASSGSELAQPKVRTFSFEIVSLIRVLWSGTSFRKI